ncbi:MAG: GWxTD domain-containing protein [bacterium]
MLFYKCRRYSAFLIGWTVLCAGANSTSLPDRYRKWLEEEVVYIIADSEIKEFKSLTTDLEREAFVSRFWKLRDPIPWTEENEFRQEHERRIQYANDRFHEGKPGWKTERGKTYIIHGPPDETSFIFGGNRQRIMIRGATEVLTGGVGDARSTYPVEFVRPQAEIWVYNRLQGAASATSNFQIIFARAEPANLFFLHKVIRETADSVNPSYPARVRRDSAIMTFLMSRLAGGEHKILYAGEYKFPDLDSFYESVFHPRQQPNFSLVDVQRALRDLDRSSGEVLHERLERKRRLKELVQSRVSFNAFELDVFCGSIRSETGSTLLPVTLGVDSKYAGDSLEVLLELVRPDGTPAASFVDVVHIGSADPRAGESAGVTPFLYQTRLSAQPGIYKLNVFARLQKLEAAVFLEREVVLEDFLGDQLAVSDVLLFERVIPRTEYSSARKSIDNRFLGGSRPLLLKDFVLVPTADVRFRRKEKLTAFFEVYNPRIASDTQTPVLKLNCRLWKDELPVGWVSATQLDYLTNHHEDKSKALRTSYGLSIPLNTFDPGNYALEVQIHDQIGNQSVTSRTGFTVY